MNLNKLELLELAKTFDVTQSENGFYVDFKHSEENDISAFIGNDGYIEYYITDCYDSGLAFIQIKIDRLNKMKKFCELFKEVE